MQSSKVPKHQLKLKTSTTGSVHVVAPALHSGIDILIFSSKK